MHLAILAALRVFFGWLLGQVVLKAVILTGLALVLAFLGSWLWSLMPSYLSANTLTAVFNAIPAGIWWFLDYVRLPQGLPIVLGAVLIAFLIRRLPVIG